MTSNKKIKFILASAVILLCITLSTVFSLIPSGYFKLDLTKNKMYTLGEISEDIVSAVDDEVTLYLIATKSTQNETLITIMERYSKLNPKIKVKLADPENDAKLIASYYGGTIEENGILAVSEKRSRYIPYSSLFNYSADTYSGCYQLYLAYIQAGYISSSSCDFQTFMTDFAPYLGIYDGYDYELQITSAVKYVSSDSVKTVYMLLGHNESISEDIVHRLQLNMYNFFGINLSTTELPKDAECLVLMPKTDITDKEYQILSEYLSDGGKIYLATSYSPDTEYKNLLKLTSEMGLTTEFKHYLCEDDENYNYAKQPGYVVPDISDSVSADVLKENGAMVMFAGATGIKADEIGGVKHTPILTTSPTAYAKVPGTNLDSLKFDEETDTRSSYYIAIKAEKENSGSLVWFSSDAIVYDEYDPLTLRGNKLILISTLNSFTSNDGHPNISPKIPSSEPIKADISYIYTFIAIFVVLFASSLIYGFIRIKKQ